MKHLSLGFSLAELLATISVIALLAAILLPSIRATRERALSAQCLSNLRQFGVMYGLYSQDYDGWLCTPVSWNYLVPSGSITMPHVAFPTMMKEYLGDDKITDTFFSAISGKYRGGKSILDCPSNPLPLYYTVSSNYGMNESPWLNLVNPQVYPNYTPAWRKQNDVKLSDEIILLGDSDATFDGFHPISKAYYGHRLNNTNTASWGKWHKNKTSMNLLFFDGHAAPIRADNLRPDVGIGDPPWFTK